MKNIPNIITLFNLFFGCCALVSIFHQEFIQAFVFLLAGGVADYMDGMFARILKVNSNLGKELDSIADMVSFGVVPGAIIYQLLVYGMTGSFITDGVYYPALAGFVVSMFAGVRLARFNLDERQTDDFIGLNTPSCTMFVVGLMLIFELNSFGLKNFVSNPYFLISCVVILSYLLNANLFMFGFKFKALNWKGNETRFTFVGLSIILFIVFREVAFSLIILIYILIALVINLTSKNTIP